MLGVLLLAGFVTVLSVAFGVPLLRLFDPAPPRFLAAALAGFAVLSAGTALVSLVLPLGKGPARGLVLGAAAVAAFSASRALGAAIAAWRSRARALSRPALLAGALLALAVLGRAAGRVTVYDTGLYHAQAIRWAEEEPAVPGLGNLHVRLVHSPAWFPVAAFFALRDQPSGPHRPLGAALALWIVLASAAALDDLARGEGGVGRLVAAALGVAMLHVLFLWLSSPAPDVAAALLAWGAIVLVLDGAESGFSSVPSGVRAAVVAVAAVAPFVSPSATPLVLPAALLVATALDWRTRARLAVLALAVVAPFVVRNAILTGYPFHPVLLPALDVDWRIPEAMVRDELAWVKSWARVSRLSPEEVLGMPAREWLPRWWGALFASDKAMLLVAAALLVPGAVRLRRSPGARVVLATCALALGVWLATAPDPRLAWGFLVPLAILLVASLVPVRRWPGAGYVAVALLGAVLLRNTQHLLRKGQEAGWGGLLSPAAYPAAPTHDAEQAGLALHVPDSGDQCWDAPVPCTPYPWQPVALRGKTLARGFRHPPGAPFVGLPR